MTEWTTADQNAADAEGWNIFEAEGSVQNKDGRSPYQIQRIDFPEDEEGNQIPAPFGDDRDAWEHIWSEAAAGSELHQRAIQFVETNSPGEYAHITDYLNNLANQPAVRPEPVDPAPRT